MCHSVPRALLLLNTLSLANLNSALDESGENKNKGVEIKNPPKRWVFNIACGRIRTSDRLVRSQVLYPAELHTRKLVYF